MVPPLLHTITARTLTPHGPAPPPQDLNPLPLVAIIANCTGWLLYGCILADPYVIAANWPGLLLGIFMTVTCYGFADLKVCRGPRGSVAPGACAQAYALL